MVDSGMHGVPALSPGRCSSLSWLARLMALVALVMQLAAASAMPAAAAPLLGGLDAPICHAAPDSKAPAPHHSKACALCPLCQTLAQSALAIAPSGSAVPLPAARAVRPAAWHPAAALPDHRAGGPPFPTGPPHTV